jgi:pSer/pThr/pTyr-binding forkhead associated (FHA) protein
MAVRLRYLAHDLEVPVGQFVIGRSPECQLSLDDPLVSRRHAVLTVHDEHATVEDLGSRNGVMVNGSKIEGSHDLSDSDKITIGSQEIIITYSAEAHPASTKRIDTRMRLPTLTGPQGDEPEAVAPPAASIAEAAAAASLVMLPDELRDDVEEDSTTFAAPAIAIDRMRQPDKRINSLALIGGVADKALALGRAEEAERLLARSLTEVLEKAATGHVDATICARAALYATKLADATGRGGWVDYIFELYTTLGALLPAHVVDELYDVVRNVKIDRAALSAYIEMLRRRSPKYGPGERFIQQRIEGLERLGALR